MTARLILAILLATLSTGVLAQSRANIERHGNVSILEVSSAELPDLLNMVRKRTAIGFANKWEMPSEVLNQDMVLADEIVFEKGRRLLLSPKGSHDNIVYFIARTIRIAGSANAPVTLIWDRNIAGQTREPVRFGKAASGAAGEREGADGRPGSDGVAGNRGLTGQDAPAVVFIALKFDLAGSVRFQQVGQDGGNGGPGQDGGDGGPGRSGRPGLLAASSIGISIKRDSVCEPAIHGGNGGRGGNGGPGGDGGAGGDGGNVGVISIEISRDLVEKLVDPNSTLAAGKNGARGARGFGGRGGPGASAVLASAPCEPSKAGRDGAVGDGPEVPMPESQVSRRSGQSGSVVYTRLNESQARSIGLLADK